MSQITDTAIVSQKKKRTAACLQGGILVVLISLSVVLCLSGILLIIGFQQVDRSPKIIELGERQDKNIKPAALSAQQNALVKEIGWPQSFAVLFYTVDGETGENIDVRDEIWTYYDLQKTYQFINGNLTGESPLPGESPFSEPIPYKPDQFSPYMGLDQVLSAAGLDRYLELPLEDEIVPGSRLYYAHMLTFALQDGKLRYVETLAIEKGTEK